MSVNIGDKVTLDVYAMLASVRNYYRWDRQEVDTVYEDDSLVLNAYQLDELIQMQVKQGHLEVDALDSKDDSVRIATVDLWLPAEFLKQVV